MKIRYFFSWEGLSKFLLAPVFKVGLASILVTPFIASIYISLQPLQEIEIIKTYFNFDFPIRFHFPTQIGFLFFSGVFIVIARILHEGFCPRLVKAYVNPGTLNAQNLQNTQWLQTELEYCLFRHVVKLPMDEDYVRGKQIREMQKKWREGSREEEHPPGYSSIVPELAEHRVGFDKYGVWLIENLLLRIATEKNVHYLLDGASHKNFISVKNQQYQWISITLPSIL